MKLVIMAKISLRIMALFLLKQLDLHTCQQNKLGCSCTIHCLGISHCLQRVSVILLGFISVTLCIFICY